MKIGKWLFKALFEKTFNVFDVIVWFVVATLCDVYDSAWWLLLLIPFFIASAVLGLVAENYDREEE